MGGIYLTGSNLVGMFLLNRIQILKLKGFGIMDKPIKKHHFILGKLVSFWILSRFVLTIWFLISWIGYGIVSEGSFITIYIFAAVFLLAVLGLLISTYSNTRQAMLISFL